MTDSNTKNKSTQGRLKYPIAGILMMLCIGNVYSWSVFSKPLIEGYGAITQDVTTFAFQINIVINTIAMIFAGRLMIKWGPRPIAIFSGITMAIGFILTKFFGHTPAGLYICFSLIAGTGMGVGYVTPLATVLKWYPDKRGLMSGLVVMGMGAGSIFGGLCGPLLIGKFGVMNTFAIFGILFGVIVTTCGAILKNPPKDYSVETVDTKSDEPAKQVTEPVDWSSKEMLKTVQFYLLWIVFLIGTAPGLMFISKSSGFGQDIGKLSAVLAGSIVMMTSIFNGLGRPTCGALSDKIGRRNVIFVAFVVSFIALVGILPYTTGNYILCLIGATMIGFSYGGFLGTMPSIASDYFGLKNVGLNYAWVYTGWGAAGYFGPQIYTYFVSGKSGKELLAAWNNAFYFSAGLCILGMVLWFFTKPPVKKQAA